MKLIAVTQRVEFIKAYKEKRDSLDQKWIDFLNRCDLVPVLLPNNLTVAKHIVTSLEIQGMLFTGGNNLAKYEGDVKERDEVEKFCINFSIENNLPVLGVCRGMQFIQDYFGVRLKKINGHVNKSQEITLNGKKEVVNSFHNWGTEETNENLIIAALANDGVIESVKSEKYKMLGIMWHPERIYPFSQRDIELFTNFYK